MRSTSAKPRYDMTVLPLECEPERERAGQYRAEIFVFDHRLSWMSSLAIAGYPSRQNTHHFKPEVPSPGITR
jgi:hypothetical protein